MIGIGRVWIRVFFTLVVAALPLTALAADRIVVLEHYTNFR